jgi:SAM-dependent methyltransferase
VTLSPVSLPDETSDTLWQRHARQWALLGPPLRPSGDDLVWAQGAIDESARRCGTRPVNGLLLGVTPALAELSWPERSRLVAADFSLAMIRGVWPGPRAEGAARWAVCANWLQLPLAPCWCDLVLADGCFAIFDPVAATRFARSIHEVLRPGGVLSTRVYLRPEKTESAEDVWHELLGGLIGNIHVFKFRLLAALHRGDGQVCVADAWDFISSHCRANGGLDGLARHLGWPPEEVHTLEAYRDQPTVYRFFTDAEFREIMSGIFTEVACLRPGYEVGERYPTFVLTRL